MTHGPLISPEELAADHDAFTILDVRYAMGAPAGAQVYAAGHVANARYVDLDTDLADPPGRGGRHPLPEPGRFEAAMRRVGVMSHRPVVVYDDWQGRAAARAWWLLRLHGHRDVRVLDGGWSAWVAAGHGVSLEDPALVDGDFCVSAAPAMPVVEASELARVDILIDARAAERYAGTTEPVDPVAGHIPGAVNVATSSNLDTQGRFLSPSALREVYAEVGADQPVQVAVYCGSGVTAAHSVLALDSAGIAAALYPGSWSGWITDPSRPISRSSLRRT